jgi:hypothetical protein
LIDDGEFSIAVVVSHMACEVAVERAFNEAFPAKGLSYLEDPVMAFVSGHNLATDRICNLYTALTGGSPSGRTSKFRRLGGIRLCMPRD